MAAEPFQNNMIMINWFIHSSINKKSFQVFLEHADPAFQIKQ